MLPHSSPVLASLWRHLHIIRLPIKSFHLRKSVSGLLPVSCTGRVSSFSFLLSRPRPRASALALLILRSRLPPCAPAFLAVPLRRVKQYPHHCTSDSIEICVPQLERPVGDLGLDLSGRIFKTPHRWSQQKWRTHLSTQQDTLMHRHHEHQDK
jgi:hypothetical protein